jgi:hypothetical protein
MHPRGTLQLQEIRPQVPQIRPQIRGIHLHGEVGDLHLKDALGSFSTLLMYL